METTYSSSMTPSDASAFLRKLIGKRVAKFVRYSWWPADNVEEQIGIEKNLTFSLTAGPLAIYFEDGSILGIASDSALNSVIVWNELERRTNQKLTSLDEDDELFPISANGEFATSYWQQLIGLSLSGMAFLMKEIMSDKEKERPSEIGIRFYFEGNLSFVVSHGLHDNSDDFSVLEESQVLNIELNEFDIFANR